MFVDDHEVHVEELQSPILMRPQELADDIEVRHLVDPDEDDRQVAGDAVRPQPGRTALVPGQYARRRPERRIRVQDAVGQPLEEMSLFGVDAEVPKLHLGLRPRQRGGALERCGLAVLVREVEDVVAGVGDDRREDHARCLAGWECDTAPKAEDRVEHRADGVGQGPAIDDRHRRPDRAAAAEEPRPVRLILNVPDRALLHRHHVGRPHLALELRPRATSRHECADLLGELGLDEEVLEGWMGDVRRERRQDDLGV